MTADLKLIRNPVQTTSETRTIHSKLTKTVTALYVFTLLITILGTGFALYQNWTIRVEQATTHLVRSANMTNFLVETALTNAAKSLDNTEILFSKALKEGKLNGSLAHEILKTSDAKFRSYSQSDVYGLIFFVGRNGKLLAQSEGQADTNIDFSDRLYFYQLRDNPHLKTTIGPLVFARTTGQWVFHMSMAVYDKEGALAGVLVQQILEKEISRKLVRYADANRFQHMMTYFDGIEPSFVYPSPGTEQAPSKELLFALGSEKTESFYKNALLDAYIVGFAKSQTFDLRSCATFRLDRLQKEFLEGNKYLILAALIGILFSSAIFYYLFAMSKKLSAAQMASLHDPLTRLHNRRALDEVLPSLLRDAMRSQQPISVLFIDIDHFRYFNDNYGHESGDVALQVVAQTMSACARRPLDFVCRWGGEEFVVVLPHTNTHAAMRVADNILNAVREIELQCSNGEQPKLTVSIGHVTSLPSTNLLQDDLIDQADKAMLQAKNQGRNRRVAYTQPA
jgi:diguanylate cyclase (GGDEF)-like protein